MDRRGRWRAFVGVAALVASSVAVAGTIDPAASDEDHVSYGRAFECVAVIVCKESDGDKRSASCVVISPRWVVTAAHVVHEASDVVVLLGGVRLEMDRVICHENYVNESVGWHDIAVCHSTEDMVLEYYPGLYSDMDEVGKIASMSGYGVAGTWKTGSVLADGQRRAGSNFIDSVEKGTLTCTVSGGQQTRLEFLIASGDSGGGLFIGNKLAGIASFLSVSGRPPESKAGETSHHTRVSLYKEWIDAHTR